MYYITSQMLNYIQSVVHKAMSMEHSIDFFSVALRPKAGHSLLILEVI